MDPVPRYTREQTNFMIVYCDMKPVWFVENDTHPKLNSALDKQIRSIDNVLMVYIRLSDCKIVVRTTRRAITVRNTILTRLPLINTNNLVVTRYNPDEPL